MCAVGGSGAISETCTHARSCVKSGDRRAAKSRRCAASAESVSWERFVPPLVLTAWSFSSAASARAVAPSVRCATAKPPAPARGATSRPTQRMPRRASATPASSAPRVYSRNADVASPPAYRCSPSTAPGARDSTAAFDDGADKSYTPLPIAAQARSSPFALTTSDHSIASSSSSPPLLPVCAGSAWTRRSSALLGAGAGMDRGRDPADGGPCLGATIAKLASGCRDALGSRRGGAAVNVVCATRRAAARAASAASTRACDAAAASAEARSSASAGASAFFVAARAASAASTRARDCAAGLRLALLAAGTGASGARSGDGGTRCGDGSGDSTADTAALRSFLTLSRSAPTSVDIASAARARPVVATTTTTTTPFRCGTRPAHVSQHAPN